MYNRRKFIRDGFMVSMAMGLGAPSFAESEDTEKLTILHTNDTHSRLEPFPMDGSRNQGMGGIEPRHQLIEKIRQEVKHVLLLDAGDYFQGTPYFNLFKGEPEIRAMSQLGYDAATIGNHDFDAGVDNLALQVQRHASFPLVICNYDFRETAMENLHQPYKIFKKGKLKIGVTGVGIDLKGYVPEELYGKTKYLDPVSSVNVIASKLKDEHDCDLVICLSHLGYQYRDNTMSDEKLARASRNVDMIIGGHTHTFLDAPVSFPNEKGDEVLVNQVGFAGIILGRIDLEFSKFSRKKITRSALLSVKKKQGE